MTAEEKLSDWINDHPLVMKAAKNAMIEFAKYHVRKALVAAHRQHQIPEEELDFTLDAYSEENIK